VKNPSRSPGVDLFGDSHDAGTFSAFRACGRAVRFAETLDALSDSPTPDSVVESSEVRGRRRNPEDSGYLPERRSDGVAGLRPGP